MNRLRIHRKAAGLSQTELAARAGLSRQLVGAAEAGRNMPRVDAGVALAKALGVSVEELFSDSAAPVAVLTGEVLSDGAVVRSGRVGETIVGVELPGPDLGYGMPDGVVEGGRLVPFAAQKQGLVVAGCEPGLEMVETALRQRGVGALAVGASSAAAIAALAAGRIHAAVVHGPALARVDELGDVLRIRMASWQVGLADNPDASSGWFDEALAGRLPVVQRESGAGVQQTFEAAATVAHVPGPQAASHREAAVRAVYSGIPAVTIEPAALAVGAVFQPLDVHRTELWIDRRWEGDRVVTEALDFLASRAYRTYLTSVGGYDLAGFGEEVS